MAGGESNGHRQLKRGAFVWAQSHGYTACAEEVRLPNSGFRADVVAFKSGRGDPVGRTAVFECKWSRGDFLGDAADLDASANRLRKLEERREILESNLRVHHPNLRTGESLFPEYDAVDLSKLEHRTYRAVTREIEILQRKIRGGSKFDRVARYRCADLCYLVTRNGICRPEEIPPGWGWLDWDGETTAEEPDGDDRGGEPVPAFSLRRRPERRECGDPVRFEMLKKIAEAATRLGNRRFAIAPGLPFTERRRQIQF